ncbi:MAG TPA: TlyA family RNA methyltransferase [Acidimicrobiia bacterium]|nr:TlyA family RNA methyltransferase [Acidimicrobiia bacterium]
MRRRLDTELVRRGLVPSRSRAAHQIEAGNVTVAGAPARSAARLVDGAEPIVVMGPPPRFVSRGGEKLEAALDHFGVAVSDRRALDAGASTGGFTDCLLQRGAREVVAVDVGRGQLAWSLRNDPRVAVLERTNVRHLELADLGEPAEVATADLSFISLVLVAPALHRLTTADADLVALVKPQFEAGRANVGRGGIVRDPQVHRAVLARVVHGLADQGLSTVAAMASPLRGADGNREFLIHARKSAAGPVDDATLDRIVEGRDGARGEAADRHDAGGGAP